MGFANVINDLAIGFSFSNHVAHFRCQRELFNDNLHSLISFAIALFTTYRTLDKVVLPVFFKIVDYGFVNFPPAEKIASWKFFHVFRTIAKSPDEALVDNRDDRG